MSNKNDSDQNSGHSNHAKTVTHHGQQPSKLLMRHIVKKPRPVAKHMVKAQGQLNIINPGEIQPPIRLEKRFARAKHTPKSTLISHFSAVTATTVASPALALEPAAAPRPGPSQVLPAKPVTKHPLTTSEILEHAINHATAHENKPPKHPRSRIRKQLGIVASVTFAVGMLTVVAANSLPGAQLHVASAKAGISAKLPNFTPAGFSQAGLDSRPGEVAAQFQNTSDGRSYTITQRASSWDSTALVNNFVAQQDPNYQTIKSGGRIIYVYGNRSASWIANGLWYNVDGHGALSNQQLVELANSL